MDRENLQKFQNGSVRKKGNKWYYRFRMQSEDGTWKLHEFPGGETKRETESMLRKALEDYNLNGRVFRPGNLTVSVLGALWYADEVEHSALTTNGRNDYRNVLRQIREHPLGSTKLKNVTCEQLQAYVDEKYFGEFDENGRQLKHAYSESHMRKQFHVLDKMCMKKTPSPRTLHSQKQCFPARSGARTLDTLIKSQVLYQLS